MTTEPQGPTLEEPRECARCQHTGWICEEHPAYGWNTGAPCGPDCAGPGVPCPSCNPLSPYVAQLEERCATLTREAEALRAERDDHDQCVEQMHQMLVASEAERDKLATPTVHEALWGSPAGPGANTSDVSVSAPPVGGELREQIARQIDECVDAYIVNSLDAVGEIDRTTDRILALMTNGQVITATVAAEREACILDAISVSARQDDVEWLAMRSVDYRAGWDNATSNVIAAIRARSQQQP